MIILCIPELSRWYAILRHTGDQSANIIASNGSVSNFTGWWGGKAAVVMFNGSWTAAAGIIPSEWGQFETTFKYLSNNSILRIFFGSYSGYVEWVAEGEAPSGKILWYRYNIHHVDMCAEGGFPEQKLMMMPANFVCLLLFNIIISVDFSRHLLHSIWK